MLDYRGHVGRQYNPIAIAQWGLGNWNLWRRTGDRDRRRALDAGGRLVGREPRAATRTGFPCGSTTSTGSTATRCAPGGTPRWRRDRACRCSAGPTARPGDERYLEAAHAAFEAMTVATGEGGVLIRDGSRRGVARGGGGRPADAHPERLPVGDVGRARLRRRRRGRAPPGRCSQRCGRTLQRNLPAFDCGFWSLYEQSGTRLPMLASPFYHRLHINQLGITARAAGHARARRAGRSAGAATRAARGAAGARSPQKALFKALYY